MKLSHLPRYLTRYLSHNSTRNLSRVARCLSYPLVCSLLVLVAITSKANAAGLMVAKDADDSLDILEHHVHVVIENGYAITSIEQVFHNKGAKNAEAIYSFPVPHKAAVGEFSYWINSTPVVAEVVEKQQARTIYEEQKQQGRATALVEKDAYRTFDIAIANIQNEERVRTKLTYIQAVHIDTAIGRYVYPLEDGGVDEESLQFWTQNEKVQESFSFTMDFRSAYPVAEFRLPKHSQAKVEQISELEWRVSMSNETGEVYNLDTDIVAYWRYPDDHPAHVDLLTYKKEGSERGTYMLTITPGNDLEAIVQGRDWVFVLDYSGSMQGKYRSMVEGVRKGLDRLNPEDRFRIVIFDSRAREITQGFSNATAANVNAAISQLEQEQVGSSTNLYDGLDKGINLLDADRTSAILLVTDGVTNIGKTEKKDFLDLLQQADVRLFTFVMGNSANKPLLQGMTEVSSGFAVNISNSDDIVGRIMEATSKLSHAAMHDVEVKISGIKVSEQSPSRIGSVYRGEQLIIFGHYWGGSDDKENQVSIALTAKVGGKKVAYDTSFVLDSNRTQSNENPELERLWAFSKIEELENSMHYFGENSDTEQAITDIALEFGLVTDYTSMLILEEQQYESYGIERRNQQRVETEHRARESRKQSGVQNNRVDTKKPMHSKPASNHRNGGGSGGGSIHIYGLLLLMVLVGFRRYEKGRL